MGHEIALKARQALAALEAVPQLAAAARTPLTGPLRVGIIPTIGPFLIPQLVRNLREHFPRLLLSITEDTTEHLLEKLSLGQLDILVLAMPCLCDGTETHPLWQDPFRVIMPPDHPFSALPAVPASQLSEHSMIMMEDGHCLRDQTLAICRQSPSRSGSEGESDSTFTAMSLHSMAEMVELGLGIAIMPELAIHAGILHGRNLIARPLTSDLARRTIGLAWRPRSPRAADFQTLATTFAALAPPVSTSRKTNKAVKL